MRASAQISGRTVTNARLLSDVFGLAWCTALIDQGVGDGDLSTDRNTGTTS